MSQLTTITGSVVGSAAGALVTLGAVAALASAGNPTAPSSHPADTVVRPAGITLNGIDRAPTDAIPAATAIEYGLIAAVYINVDHSATDIGVLKPSAATDLAVAKA